MRGLQGKIALVIGGTGLIGSAIVHRLVAEGARVIVASRSYTKASEWIAEQETDQTKLIPLELVLDNPEQITKSLGQLHEDGITPTILIACASLREGLGVPFEKLDQTNFNPLFNIDVTGHFLCARDIVQRLPVSEDCSMVFLSSIYGTLGVDHSLYDEGMSPTPPQYATVKAAQIGLMRYLAAMWGHRNIRVNAVIAGGVRSLARQNETFLANYIRKTMLGRMATSDEIASAVVFLVSSDASYITGECLVVDGGFSAW